MFLDVETTEHDHPTGKLLRPSFWALVTHERRQQRAKPAAPMWQEGKDACSLANSVDAIGKSYRGVWVWAHNIGFDAVATGLPRRLVERGWEVTEFGTRGANPFFRLRKGRHSLTLVDSFSWLPVALKGIGNVVGIQKGIWQEVADNADELANYCRRDVRILATAILELLDWWDRNSLGRWTITGASCGWNAYRHITPRQRVVIEADDSARTFERRAIYGGRRDAFRIGEFPRGEYVDMDFEAAYPTAVAHFPLPIRRTKQFASLALDHPYLTTRTYGIIAEVTHKGETSCAPVRSNESVWYPVGEFRTVLASPEILPCLQAGHIRAIHRGYAYRLGYSMQPWARWVVSLLDKSNEDTPEVARMAAKQWSRSVIGKWATRTSHTEKWGPAPTFGWHLEEGRDVKLKVPVDIVDMGGQRWKVTRDLEGDNTFPAITAFVESYVRAALTRVINTLPPSRVLQCDTDGFLLDNTVLWKYRSTRGHESAQKDELGEKLDGEIQAAIAAAAPFRLVPKRHYQQVTVLGPQHIRLDSERRFSGIPERANEVSPNTFVASYWPKMSWQMAHGSADGYVLTSRTVRVKGPYTHRWCLDDSWTWPVSTTVDENGDTQLLPPPSAFVVNGSPHLSNEQHPVLARLLAGGERMT